MKTPFLVLLLGAATLIHASTLPAQENRYDEIVKRYDRNGDGKLDDAEWAAARAQLGRRLEQRRPQR